MVKKSSGWNLAEMQETLVKDTEQRIEQGFEEIRKEVKESGQGAKGAGTDVSSGAIGDSTVGTVSAEDNTRSAVADRPGEPVPAVPHVSGVPTASVPQAAVYRTARMFHKERTQDVLVHCPVSLHKRLKDLKDHIWDEYGERVNINNMVIEAIALWLDQQEGKCKVSATT